MAEIRPIEARVLEKQEQLERTLKRLNQQREQLKQLQTRAKDEERKQRTHKLITAGAELAALFEHVLELEEVYQVVNYLREQMAQGRFELVKKEKSVQEAVEIQQEENQEDDSWGLDGMFEF